MRYLMLISVLLLGVSWAVAQSDSASTASQSSASRTASGAATGGSTTVQGCLSGSDGSYTLTDREGKTYQLTGDTSKLSEHVGHEIRVTGEANASSGMGTNSSAGQTSTGSETISVSSVKHISKTCKNAMSK